MNKHTPGPWRIAEKSKQEDPDYFDIEAPGQTNHQRHVGHVHNWSIEDIANARLIAAAPDLLRTLERIADARLAPADDLRQAARDAVDIATGKLLPCHCHPSSWRRGAD